MKTKLLLCILCIVAKTIFSQTTILHPTIDRTITLNPGLHYYYDNGGPGANYSAGMSSTLTIKPAKNHFIWYGITEFNVEKLSGPCPDFLRINPYIFHCEYYGNPTEDYCGDMSDVSRIGFGAALCDGRDLVSYFQSDVSIQRAGWKIFIEVLPKDLSRAFCFIENVCPFPLENRIQANCGDEFDISINRFSENACGGLIDIYEGCGSNFTGNEKLIEFYNDKTQDVTVTFQGNTLLDVFLINGCQCLGTAKAANGRIQHTFKSVRAGVYKIIIEHTIPGNDIENINGKIECGNTGPSGKLDCNAALPISCGQTVVGSTLLTKNNVEKYLTCQGTINMTGNEIIYNFTSDVTGNVTIELSALQANLDLFLLEACDVNGNCLMLSRNASNNKEKISFYAIKNSEYYIVVDGNNKSNSTFQLSVSCDSEECQTCGGCFTYGLQANAGKSTSKIKCFNKFVKCNDASFPSMYKFEWYRQGILLSTGVNLEWELGNRNPVEICQKIYKGNVLAFQCCRSINPSGVEGQGPIAHFSSTTKSSLNLVCDAQQANAASNIFMQFGDGGTGKTVVNGKLYDHNYKNAGNFIVCEDAENAFGISRYCHAYAIGNSDCFGPRLFPKFSVRMNSANQMTITAVNAEDISLYDVQFGDGQNRTGNKWAGPIVHSYGQDDIYEVVIKYKQTFAAGSFPCEFEACASFIRRGILVSSEHISVLGKVEIKPNPAKDYIEISGIEGEISEGNLEIINIDGKSMALKSRALGERIDVSTWPGGVYFVKIKIGKATMIKKWLKL